MALLAPFSSAAQCPEWSADYAARGTNGTVYASTVFDDGSGPALYFGGAFTRAGTTMADRVARFDGVEWSALGSGMPTGEVHALCVFDDGMGPALYAGGTFLLAGGTAASAIAKWNGTSWSSVGGGVSNATPLTVEALCVFDDGTGPALYAGGDFTLAGGVPANAIAKWNGTSWSAVGGGMNDWVLSLCVHDDGSGPALWAGGYFTLAGGAPANCVARWNGTSWAAAGSGMTLPGAPPGIRALASFDDGAGPRLFAGGSFSIAGGASARGFAKWDGASWSPVAVLGNVGPPEVYALAMHDDGSGPALFAGGSFSTPPTDHQATTLLRWDGTALSSAGLLHGVTASGTSVRSLTVWNRGLGPRLVACGSFAYSDLDAAACLAELDGAGWRGFDVGDGCSGAVLAFGVHDDGGGAKLHIGGSFRSAGATVTSSLARWTGGAWSSVGDGMNRASATNVRAVASHDDGSGSALYVGGDFTGQATGSIPYLARWNGTSWSAVGGLANSSVYALGVFDLGTGPALYVTGLVSQIGGSTFGRVARWDGTIWVSLGGGITSSGFGTALGIHDFGAGPELILGGAFSSVGGVPANNIARWNGNQWAAIGSGLPGGAFAFASYDAGGGPMLHAGGIFASMGNIARWNGTSWSQLGTGTNNSVRALAVQDDGTGPKLWVGGTFTQAGGLPTVALAKWNGANWSNPNAIQSEPGGVSVLALAVNDHDHDGVADLFLGGFFTAAGGRPAANVTRLQSCAPSITTYCPGDGTVRACPCDNQGAAGRGCANANFAAGARLQALGTPSVSSDTLVLSADSVTGSTCVFFQGTANMDPIVVDDGLGCVTGSVIRLAIRGVAGNSSTYPQGADLPVSVRGLVPPEGGRRFYQAYYRNASSSFCPPATSNRTNGVAVLWAL